MESTPKRRSVIGRMIAGELPLGVTFWGFGVGVILFWGLVCTALDTLWGADTPEANRRFDLLTEIIGPETGLALTALIALALIVSLCLVLKGIWVSASRHDVPACAGLARLFVVLMSGGLVAFVVALVDSLASALS